MIAHCTSVADMGLFRVFNKDLPDKDAMTLCRTDAIQICLAKSLNNAISFEKIIRIVYIV